MTLVELLVVIVLITTLVSTAIPILSPGGDGRRLREASRNLNAYLQGAQARAIETGRPFGVAMKRLSSDTGRGEDNAACVRLNYVEVPAPYTGLDGSSLVRIAVGENPTNNLRQIALQFVRYGTDTPQDADNLPPGYDFDLVPDRFLRPGDIVQVGSHTFALAIPGPVSPFMGYRNIEAYPAASSNPNNGEVNAGYLDTSILLVQRPIRIVFAVEADVAGIPDLILKHDTAGAALGAPESYANTDSPRVYFTEPVPYRILRQPVTAAGEPLEMPVGVAVDLQASVFLDGRRLYEPSPATYDVSSSAFAADTDPVMLLFSPEGNISRAYFGATGQQGENVTSTLALCVGRRELIPAPPTDRAKAAMSAPASFNEPIDLALDVDDAVASGTLTEGDAEELINGYNWLNLDSRWVVVGAQSGSVSTVENSGAYPFEKKQNGDIVIDKNNNGQVEMQEQLAAALANVSRRTRDGGN